MSCWLAILLRVHQIMMDWIETAALCVFATLDRYFLFGCCVFFLLQRHIWSRESMQVLVSVALELLSKDGSENSCSLVVFMNHACVLISLQK